MRRGGSCPPSLLGCDELRCGLCRITDMELQPLQSQLFELDEEIRRQQEQIRNIKANVIKNDAVVHQRLKIISERQ